MESQAIYSYRVKSEGDELTERREITDQFHIHLETTGDEDRVLQKHNQHPIHPKACRSLGHSVILPVVDTTVSPLHVSKLVQGCDTDEQDRNRPISNGLNRSRAVVRGPRQLFRYHRSQ